MITLTPTQRLVFEDSSNIRMVFAGRRWGATTLAMFTAQSEADKGKTVLLVEPTQQMAQSVWKRMHQDIPAYYDYEKMCAYIGGVGRVFVKSDIASIHWHQGVDSVVVDEAAFCHHDVWVMLRQPNRTPILMFTPLNRIRHDWTVRLAKKLVKSDTGRVFSFTTFDTPYVDKPSITEGMRGRFTSLNYHRQFFGLSGGWEVEV